MARNGTGTFSLLVNSWNPAVNGVTATAADWQALINDVAASITQSVSADGQTPMTGNLQMGNNKLTGLAVGTANTDAVNLSQVNSNAGQCRLVKSGANLVLQPFQGNRLTINGAVYSIPSGGVVLAPTGSTAAVLYYIYAYMVGAVMTLEYSTTGHSTDTTTGVEIKTGDVTRTLVGMARAVTGPAWADSAAQRLVASWFNRRPVAGYVISSGALSTASVTFVSLLSLEFLMWGDSSIPLTTNGTQTNNTASAGNYNGIGIDSSTASTFAPSYWQAFTSNANAPATQAIAAQGLAEGYHTAYALGRVSGGIGSWSAPNGFELSAMLWI